MWYLFISFLTLFLTPAAVMAQAPPTNDDCQTCHSDPGATRGNGSSIAVSPDVFGKSLHGGFACVDCHADLAKVGEWPHAEKLQKVSCAACHEDAVKAAESSVHYEASKNGQGAHCVNCHGTHDILSSKDPASKTYALNLPKTCATCHSGKHLEGAAGEISESYVDSVHGRGVTRAGLLVSANCTSCHGAHDIKPKTDAGSRVHRANVAATCTTCHEGIMPAFARSVHAEQRGFGNASAATCSDCHTAHTIANAETDQYKLAVIEECGDCHLDKIGTYRDTFHGQVTALGFARSATCSDCHGNHEILPASNAASMIAPRNLVATCGRCHENANENFVKYDPHADKHDRFGSPELYWSYKFMQVLLGGVFLAFGLHTVLWFPRSWKARREHAAAKKEQQP